jgi:hypothetical protein
MENFSNLFWQAYLVNFLFWASLAQGSVIFSAALNLSNAQWGRPYVHLSRYFAGFLPVCVLLFAFLLFGRVHIFPWISHPLPEKGAYLNVPFLFLRGILGLTVLAALSWAFLRHGRTGSDEKRETDSSPWAVALVISFGVIYTYLAFDLVMSLDPEWFSTLLGAYFAVSALFLGMAGLCLAGFFLPEVPREDLRRMSQLLFAFALFWVSLLWSQYIVIWYGDLPHEALYLHRIFFRMPWKAVTIAMLALGFVLPFFILMPRRAKLLGFFPLISSVCILCGLMLEKYVLVLPAFTPNRLTVGWIHAAVTLLFGGLFAASCRISARLNNVV